MSSGRYLWLLIATTVYVGAGWTTLKPLSSYSPKDFQLKDGVEYVDIRQYSKDRLLENGKTRHTKSMKVVLKMYRKPLAQYGAKIQNDFDKRAKPSYKKSLIFLQGGWGGLWGSGSWMCNGYMLDSHKKMWLLEGKKDVIEMIKPIDTPAEIKLIMWLNKHTQGVAKYKKTKKGFTVIEHYVVNSILNDSGACGDFTYRYHINHNGQITQRRLIKKKKVKVCDYIVQ